MKDLGPIFKDTEPRFAHLVGSQQQTFSLVTIAEIPRPKPLHHHPLWAAVLSAGNEYFRAGWGTSGTLFVRMLDHGDKTMPVLASSTVPLSVSTTQNGSINISLVDEQKKKAKIHTTPRYSHLVSHGTTRRALTSLCIVDRTRGSILWLLWSYVMICVLTSIFVLLVGKGVKPYTIGILGGRVLKMCVRCIPLLGSGHLPHT